MLQTEGTLKVVVNSATNMQDVDTGKQDPYVRYALNLEEKDWQKTFTAKDAGINATWNQTLESPLRGEQEMFVEVMDEEHGVDQVIGFCAIKLAPIVQAPGGHVNAIYTIYNIKGKDAGRLHLTITASGFNSPPAQQQQSMQPVQGPSYISEEHAKRIKSMRHKALAGDVGTAVLGGALAIGAGFLGHKLYKDHEQKEEQKEQERQQMEEEKERLERERQQMEEQQRRREHEEAEERRRKQEEEQRRAHGGNHHQGGEQHHHHQGGEHHHHQHESRHHGGGGASEWDPVGTYAPGDRVQYHATLMFAFKVTLLTPLGCLVLNLTGADTVIFVEHDWNPMKDLQAMDRAHRLGQKKVVNVYRLITRGTLEEKIMGLQKFKLNIANTIVNQQNSGLQSMDTDQILDLFSVAGDESTSTNKKKRKEGAAAGANTADVGDGKAKAVIENLENLWEEKDYEEEYNIDNFISGLK